MQKRYSEMAEYELHQEIAQLTEKARKAEQLGMVNEFAVLERKITLAKCYLLKADEFPVNEQYEVIGAPGTTFHVDYLNGVFAWGYRVGSEQVEEGIPISMLRKIN